MEDKLNSVEHQLIHGKAAMSGREAAAAARAAALRAGDICPVCGQGRMDYDGLLNLVCTLCGAHGGAGGCFS